MEPRSATARPLKQSMAELKLRRLNEHNQRLREDLARPRIRTSEAAVRSVLAKVAAFLRVMLMARSLIHFCTQTKDPLVSAVLINQGLRSTRQPRLPPLYGSLPPTCEINTEWCRFRRCGDRCLRAKTLMLLRKRDAVRVSSAPLTSAT